MNSNEMKRWLKKMGVKVGKPVEGSHAPLTFNGRHSTLPIHSKEIPTGTYYAILKQLGLKK